jgi:hypothetical protein
VRGHPNQAKSRPGSGSISNSELPTPYCDQRPHRFNQSERPRPLQEAIGRSESTCYGETEDEPWASIFKGVRDEHRRDGEKAEASQNIHCRMPAFRKSMHLGSGHTGDNLGGPRLTLGRLHP